MSGIVVVGCVASAAASIASNNCVVSSLLTPCGCTRNGCLLVLLVADSTIVTRFVPDVVVVLVVAVAVAPVL